MASKELLDKMRQHYSEARELAKELWISMDNEGNNNDYYYFECGFVAGLNYNPDGSLREQKPKYSKEFLEFANRLFEEDDYEKN